MGSPSQSTMSLHFPKVRLPRRAPGCRSCGNAVEAEQLVCLECGTLQGGGPRLGGAAWKMPVALTGALLLLMATGFGFASGAVGRDGEVTLAQAPPPVAPSAPPSGAAAQEGEGAGGSAGSALPKLPSPSAAGSGRKLGFGGGGSSGGTSSGGGLTDEPSTGSGGGGGSSPGDASPNRGSGGTTTTRTAPDAKPSAPSYGPAPKDLARFPTGQTGYVVVLKSASSRDAALREARSAVADGLTAGVASSADARGVPGRFFAFAGPKQRPVFSTQTDAERFVGNTVAPLGYSAKVTAVNGA